MDGFKFSCVVKSQLKQKNLGRISVFSVIKNYNVLSLFLDSSMVEHTAVNRGVVGSSPTRGANNLLFDYFI